MSFFCKVIDWLGRAFSENGTPSSARIISAWLSVSSMTLIWFIAKHAMSETSDKLAIWASNLPLIIGALATFSTAPYGVGKIASIFTKKEAKQAAQKPDNPDATS